MRKISIILVLAAIASNAALAGTITGIVLDDLTTLPIEGAWVVAYDYTTGDYRTDCYTNSDGFYSISSLTAGTYRVWASTWNSNYVDEYYNDTLNYEDATPVTVTSQGVRSNIDFGLAIKGIIRGTVTDMNGQPIVNIRVYAYDYATGNYCNRNVTDSEGMYSINDLTPGTYRILAYPDQGSNYILQYYNGQTDWENATPVEVNSGAITDGINFQLVSGGSISGKVTDTNGQPIANVRVSAFDYTGTGTGNRTDSDGIYSINGLAPGTYRIEAYPDQGSNYISQYYNGQTDWDNATPVEVNSGTTTENINFQLVLGGGISGIVTDPNGQPIANVWVYAYNSETGIGAGGTTDSEGIYSIHSLAPDIYRLRAYPNETSNYLRQFYNGQEDWDNATPVVVNAGDVVDDINFQLALGGGIRGIVTNSNGQPISDLLIWIGNSNEYFPAWTDADGIYERGGLPAGTYQAEISADGTAYASQLYNHKLMWEPPTPVTVSTDQWIEGIDFSLDLGVSISGVVKNSSGVALANVNVNCGVTGWWYGLSTDENGYFVCHGLPAGYTYTVRAFPPDDTNYRITTITVDTSQPGEYTNNDITFIEGSLTISGRITDKATSLPLADIRVGCWNDDVEIWTDTVTDSNGQYTLAHLLPGEIDVQVQPDSYYAYMGINELQLQDNISNLDFALPAGSTLSGKVIDAQTAQPLAGIRVTYSNDLYATWRNITTDADGSFYMTQLPPGIAEIKAEPTVDSGYAWNLPWGCDWVNLDEGDNQTDRFIALEKGALVSGYFKDSNGNPLGGWEYVYHGKPSEGWGETDADGSYQIRLAVGTYYFSTESNDTFGAMPEIITVTDINETINVPDITVYTDKVGGHISGNVNNPGNSPKVGNFMLVAFKAGTILNDPEKWDTIQPVASNRNNAGPFTLNTLPPGTNYDIYLCVDNETPDGNESLAIRDAAINVAVGTTGIALDYTSQGSTLGGIVKNTDNKPVLGATVILWGGPGFSGFARTDGSGQFRIDNVAAGTYTVTALHSTYLLASTTITVVDGIAANAGTLVMPFAGIKEGPDLNGDGHVNTGDLMVFAQQWLKSGVTEADFNQDNEVTLSDWMPIAENWLSTAIWYNE